MALLLFLIIRVRLHAFVALLLASLVIGAAAGMPFDRVLAAVTTGMGGTLGLVAVLIGLGAMFGQMLESSGGAEALAQAILRGFGQDRAQWALAVTGFVVAIPVFFDVAFIILVPIVYGLSHRTAKPLVYFALPLLAGLAATHAFMPPTPGPIAVAGILGADLGLVILFGAAAGAPAAIVAGPLFARFAAGRVTAGVPPAVTAAEQPDRALPPVGMIAFLVLVPLLLILANTISTVLLEEGTARMLLQFVGHPITALLISTILAFYLLGTRRGLDGDEIQRLATKALEPTGIIILVTGGGGVLKEVLVQSGVGDVLASALQSTALPPLALAFLLAAAFRLMQGSATVAMLSAAGLLASIIRDQPPGRAILALMVVAIAAGATTTSHVNDSGFWLVNRYLGLSVPDTFRSWTVATTLIAGVGFAVVLIIGVVVG